MEHVSNSRFVLGMGLPPTFLIAQQPPPRPCCRCLGSWPTLPASSLESTRRWLSWMLA